MPSTTQNRLLPYLSATSAAEAAIELLWDEARKALLLGDLYLDAAPEAHDRAIALGTELAELAEWLATEQDLEPRIVCAATETALEQARQVLQPLAPLA